jgi:hypothetical protein
MNDEHKSTRLGELLVERGIITRLQLAHAIELQQIRRQHAIKENVPNSYTQQFGELLIELGFINHSQLKSSLSWQKRLRKTTAMMVFVAPLFTAACGGGGGGGGTSPNNTQTPTPSSQAMSSQPVIDKPTSSDSVSSSAYSSVPISSSSKSSSIIPSVISSSLSSSSSSSSTPGIVSKSSSSVVSSSSVRPVSTSSASSSRISSISSASSSTSILSGPVHFKWTPPKQRENGDFLDLTEIGGYELRYKRKSENLYTSVIISDSYIDTYYFENLQGEYEFEIAAFDTLGVYSIFVKLKPI